MWVSVNITPALLKGVMVFFRHYGKGTVPHTFEFLSSVPTEQFTMFHTNAHALIHAERSGDGTSFHRGSIVYKSN